MTRRSPAMPVVPPIVQTSLFTFASYQELEDAMAGRVRRPIYSRGDNPTVAAFEAKLAALEGAEAARALRKRHGGDQRGRAEQPLARAIAWSACATATRTPTGCSPPCCRASTSRSSSSTAAMPARSSRRCRAPRCSTWKARPAWCSRPRISPASPPRREREGARLDRRQLLGQPDLPAAARARRRPRACTPPRSISAATATWSRAWSAAGAS